MEPRVTDGDLALLLLGEEDLVALGALLSLPAKSVEFVAEEDNEEGGRHAPASHR